MTTTRLSTGAQPAAADEPREISAARRQHKFLPMRLARAGATTAATSLLLAVVAAADDPLVMGVGLAPIAWLAIEGVWNLFDESTVR